MQAQATRATQILMAEHEVILTVLDCLERLSTEFVRAPDLASAKDVLDFLGTFADRCHHAKEEQGLFPTLVEKGLPRHVGPVAVMLAEHEQGREEIAGMRAAVANCETRGSDARRARERFVEHARAYVELLREHIAKENTVLFPMADGMLGDEDQARLLETFGNLEHHDMGAGTHERYLELAQALVTRLGVTPSARPAAHGGCCGHAGRCH